MCMCNRRIYKFSVSNHEQTMPADNMADFNNVFRKFDMPFRRARMALGDCWIISRLSVCHSKCTLCIYILYNIQSWMDLTFENHICQKLKQLTFFDWAKFPCARITRRRIHELTLRGRQQSHSESDGIYVYLYMYIVYILPCSPTRSKFCFSTHWLGETESFDKQK